MMLYHGAMSWADINRLIELQQLLNQFQTVEREVAIPGNDRGENDIEHSYGLAMIAWYLAPHFPDLNADKLIRLSLAHDMVEVHAGDTPAFSEQAHIDAKPEREEAALKQLKKDWADFPQMLEAIDEYKHKSSDEARFIYALDKILPALLVYLKQGKEWHASKVTIEKFQIEKERKIPPDSPIFPLYQALLELVKTHPEYFHKA